MLKQVFKGIVITELCGFKGDMDNKLRWIGDEGEQILFADFSNQEGMDHLNAIKDSENFKDKPNVDGVLGTYQLLNKDGEKYWLEALSSKIEVNGKAITIIFVHDVTDFLDAKQKLKEKNVELKRLMQQKDDFIIQLGHDLKTPLTPLLSLLPMIEKREQDPKLKDLLQATISNIKRMEKQVDKILEFGKVTAFGTEFDICDINLYDLINNSIETNRVSLQKNNVIVYNEIDENIIVKADELKLNEIINHLISNSVKFSTSGGEITIFAMEYAGIVTISIQDTGIGLSKEKVDLIFDEFYKVDESRHNLESSGLGLAICKRIVKKHGGEIWAESLGDEKGLTFYFTLRSVKNIDGKHN